MTDVSRCVHFRRYSLSVTGTLVLGYLVLYLLSLRHYHGVSYRDPTSYFFDADRAYERGYSAKRVAEAEAYLSAAGDIAPSARMPGQQAAICMGIVSVKRRGEQYVGLTVASVLEGLSELERSKLLLYLRIGNTDPKDHPIYSEKWVETLPDRLLTYSQEDPDFEQLKEWEDGGWYRNKTIYDFTTLMKECYDSGAEYVAMLEDDTLAVKGWFPAALRALDTVQSRNSGRDWIYLRLFYVDGLLGWNGEEWPKYLAWSFVVWALITGAMVASKRTFKAELRSIPMSAIWLTSAVFIPAAIALHFLAGRQTMWPIAPGVHEMNKYGCCSQGLVFPRAIIPRFLERTDLTTDWLVDMMIEKIADGEGWSRWAVVPPLLQHIGATSSKGYGFDNSASTIWNFRFEEYDI
ncbi:uncharacterized protein DSM5745_09473 [Aspergillus mulundensis]|uniref:Integral membrane protein n=1 Tax=Aspergillus mulundensis TaxID=1810919 RepID=A0A3D8QW41_9EURO|nr:Uncharacterized protein DSM5745_09473 [Aspergillus mulundensis]RDW65734.1 Uncharacterized protein DSM5745_09473 [Aspergillus mulundensis]